jgi:hypothetical protein
MGQFTSQELGYPDHVGRLRETDAVLAGQLADFHGIEQVLTWMQQTGRIRAAVDMVGQDEFEYEFLVELEPGGRWLVFGVT